MISVDDMLWWFHFRGFDARSGDARATIEWIGDKLKEDGYAIVKVGEVPPWMEKEDRSRPGGSVDIIYRINRDAF